MAHPVLNDPAALAERVEAYFEHCASTRTTRELKNGDIRIRQEPPCAIGLAVWLGIDKSTLYRYLNGETNTSAPQEVQQAIRDTFASARDRFELYTVHAAADGDMESRTAALLLATYGYNKPQDENSTVTVRIASAEKSADWAG